MAPRTITIELPINPVAWARPRLRLRGSTVTGYKTSSNENFERTVRYLLLSKFYGKPFEGPIELRVTFHLEKGSTVKRKYPAVRPDLSNYVKILEDSLNGYAYTDDAQIVSLVAQKRYSSGPAKISLSISEIL